MRNLWKDSGIAIVLLPTGVQGDRLYEVAKLWTELRMLAPAIWVRHELLESLSTRPPKQQALVLGVDKAGLVSEVQVDLFEQLARQPLRKVRLVVVRTALPSVEFDEKQDQLVDLLSDYLDVAMPAPMSVGESSDKLIDFVKLNLITSPTEFKSDSGSKYSKPRFNAHFIAAAEDRATPASGDAFIRFEEGSEKFAGFSMLHTASLAGIWAGLPEGTFDFIKPGVWLGDKAFVSRVFLSSILTDGLARRASSRVLERAGNPNNGFVNLATEMPVEGTFPIPVEDVQAWTQWMSDKLFEFDGRVLSYQAPVDPADVAKRELTVARQFVEFLKFSWDKMTRVPYFAMRWIYKGFVQIVNAIFQGGNKGAAVIPVPEDRMDKRDQLVLAALASVKETKEKADAALVSPVSPSHLKSTPELWSQIRKIIFGMLDGSNLNQFGVEKQENGWPIIYSVQSVFNDPSQKTLLLDPEKLSEGEPLSLAWEDLVKYPELQAAYNARKAGLETENQKILQGLIELKKDQEAKSARLEALQERLAELEEPQANEQEVTA